MPGTGQSEILKYVSPVSPMTLKLQGEDVHILERAIEEGKLPVYHGSVLNESESS